MFSTIDEQAFIQELFFGNPNTRIILEVLGVDTADQLFLFILRLFVRGLVTYFGNGPMNTVDVTQLSEKQLSRMRHAFARTGIQMHLKTELRMGSLDDVGSVSEIKCDDQECIKNISRHDDATQAADKNDLHIQIEMPPPLRLDTCALLLHLNSAGITHRLSFSAVS